MSATSSTSALTTDAQNSPALAFTCSICRTTFDGNALERAHKKGAWHVYNLKRQIASLPPVSAQTFDDQVLGSRGDADTEKDSVSMQNSCALCRKTFKNNKAYQNHLISLDHVETVAELERSYGQHVQEVTLSHDLSDASDAGENGEETTTEVFAPSKCLFCGLSSLTFDLNMLHMQKQHGLYIPDQDYLVDLETLIGYLFTVIVTFHECLYCGNVKTSAQAVRQHMLGKGHCNINADKMSEFEDFYDFPETDDLDLNNNEGGNLTPDGNELLLNSGRTVGHRSQARYYHQSVPSPAERAARAERKALADAERSSVPDQTDSGGNRTQLATRGYSGQGMIGVTELQKRSLMAVEKKMLKVEMRARNQYQAKVDKGGNSQKFYRADGPGPKNG